VSCTRTALAFKGRIGRDRIGIEIFREEVGIHNLLIEYKRNNLNGLPKKEWMEKGY
jgi:hypothetical protein